MDRADPASRRAPDPAAGEAGTPRAGNADGMGAVGVDAPVLWSFRRCPYAMRARLALSVSETPCWLREVVLRDKPAAMLEISPKGTVPVLDLGDGTVLEESLDIMLWALDRCDPEGWLKGYGTAGEELIARNDGPFKHDLDRYKYPGRYDGADRDANRAEGRAMLDDLDARLRSAPFLAGAQFGLVDAALAPFIRQFANTDRAWFDALPLDALQGWLSAIVRGLRFGSIMDKYPKWESGPGTLVFSGKTDDNAAPRRPAGENGV